MSYETFNYNSASQTTSMLVSWTDAERPLDLLESSFFAYCILWLCMIETLFQYLLLSRVILLSTEGLASSRLQDLAIMQLLLSVISTCSLHFLQIIALIFYFIQIKHSKTFNFSRYSGGISEIPVIIPSGIDIYFETIFPCTGQNLWLAQGQSLNSCISFQNWQPDSQSKSTHPA